MKKYTKMNITRDAQQPGKYGKGLILLQLLVCLAVIRRSHRKCGNAAKRKRFIRYTRPLKFSNSKTKFRT